MDTGKSSRKNQSTDDDLSYASTSSSSTITSKALFEDSDCEYCYCYENLKVNLLEIRHK